MNEGEDRNDETVSTANSNLKKNTRYHKVYMGWVNMVLC